MYMSKRNKNYKKIYSRTNQTKQNKTSTQKQAQYTSTKTKHKDTVSTQLDTKTPSPHIREVFLSRYLFVRALMPLTNSLSLSFSLSLSLFPCFFISLSLAL